MIRKEIYTRLHNVTNYSMHTPLLFDAITMEKSSLNVKSCVMIGFNSMDEPGKITTFFLVYKILQ